MVVTELEDADRPDGEGDRFGLGARRRAATIGEALSARRSTPAPSRRRGADLDTRSDIYTLGVTLWYMLTGEPPFTGPLATILVQRLPSQVPVGAPPSRCPKACASCSASSCGKLPPSARGIPSARAAQRAIARALGGLQRRPALRARVGTVGAPRPRFALRSPERGHREHRRVAVAARGRRLVPAGKLEQIGALGPEVAGRAAAVSPPPESLSTRGESTGPEQEEPNIFFITKAPPAPERLGKTTNRPKPFLENSQPPKPIAAPEAAETSTPAPPAAATANASPPKEKPLQNRPRRVPRDRSVAAGGSRARAKERAVAYLLRSGGRSATTTGTV